jgi:hypothetical protein
MIYFYLEREITIQGNTNIHLSGYFRILGP